MGSRSGGCHGVASLANKTRVLKDILVYVLWPKNLASVAIFPGAEPRPDIRGYAGKLGKRVPCTRSTRDRALFAPAPRCGNAYGGVPVRHMVGVVIQEGSPLQHSEARQLRDIGNALPGAKITKALHLARKGLGQRALLEPKLSLIEHGFYKRQTWRVDEKSTRFKAED